MTPGARVQAAIEILDTILTGTAAEQALTGWARRSRFAGSKDRAAIRDHVFDALRCRRSLAALGGAETGRGLMLGQCRRDGLDIDALFSGPPHAPPALDRVERTAGRQPAGGAEALDLPDWLWPLLQQSLGGQAEVTARALQSRAPVHLRVNRLKADRGTAADQLARDGVQTRPNPAADTALTVVSGARAIRNAAAYRDGLVELQDAASQAAVARLPLEDGMRVLDYCAGGGGKALAMAARARITLVAHDIAPDRMRDIPARARRAGARVSVSPPDRLAGQRPFDLVLCDAPCSGSGTWRRAPDAKWRLTRAGLDRLACTQREVLASAAPLVAGNGVLAYATCSVLDVENGQAVAGFLARNTGWRLVSDHHWPVSPDTDGFYLALLTRV